MQIPKIVLNEVNQVITDMGITHVAKKSKINYRTLLIVKERGECTPSVYGKLSKFLTKTKKAALKLETVLMDNA